VDVEPLHVASEPTEKKTEPTEESTDQEETMARKRKLSAEDLHQEESKRHKADEDTLEERPVIAAFKPRPRSVRPNTRRGKSVKLPQKSVSRSDVAANTAASVVDSVVDKVEQDLPKSNDDFRALLLNSKQKQKE
jgi:hypothetical protein